MKSNRILFCLAMFLCSSAFADEPFGFLRQIHNGGLYSCSHLTDCRYEVRTNLRWGTVAFIQRNAPGKTCKRKLVDYVQCDLGDEPTACYWCVRGTGAYCDDLDKNRLFKTIDSQSFGLGGDLCRFDN